MAYATTADYRAAFPEVELNDNQLSNVLENASDAIDAELFSAGAVAENVDEELLGRVCLKVAHRAVDNAMFEGVPLGVTQMNAMAGGSYQRGYSFGNGGFGEVYLTRAEKLLLGIGRPKACVLSPYGGE